MLSGVGSVAILVKDAKKSAEWYRDKLGFEIVQNKGHVVFVKPIGSGTLLHLCGKCGAWEKDRPGGRTGVWLHCGEVAWRKDKGSGVLVPTSRPEAVEEAYLELKKKGVEFTEHVISKCGGDLFVKG